MSEQAVPRELDRALSNFRSSVRRLNIAEATPPMRFDDMGAVKSFLSSATMAIAQERGNCKNKQADLDKILSSTASDGLKTWTEVDKACAKVEELLRNPPTLKMRLDEGRRSLMANINKSLGDQLEATVQEDTSGEGKVVAQNAPPTSNSSHAFCCVSQAFRGLQMRPGGLE